MKWILLIAVIAIAVMAYRSYQRTQLQAKKKLEISSAELASVKKTAEEDITKFGEELQDLDLDMVGKDLGDGARQDYQRALDAYESSKQALDAVTEADQIKHVIEILEDGRYASACARPGQRRAAAAAPPLLLLQPAARPLDRGRHLGPGRWRTARGAGLCG